jgi:hypothetical protein
MKSLFLKFVSITSITLLSKKAKYKRLLNSTASLKQDVEVKDLVVTSALAH